MTRTESQAYRALIDFNVVLPESRSGAEPTLRMLVYSYYARHFGEQVASRFAAEYCRQIEEQESNR